MKNKLKPSIGIKKIKGEDEKLVKDGVLVERIMDSWNGIINSSKNELYVEYAMQLRRVCARYPKFLKYIESIILDQVKDKIVCALTNQVRHLGNTTTNRVESAHATLKNWLGSNKYDFCIDWDSMNQMI